MSKINVVEIVTAWLTAINPKDWQKRLSEKRLEVCSTCKHKGTTEAGFDYCKSCGCPLSKKSYSPKEGACPKGKWNKIDTEYFNALEKLKKSNKVV